MRLLTAGDTVALIAPSAQLPRSQRHLLDEGTSLLGSWGLEVLDLTSPHHHFYLADTDQVRAAHLTRALHDADVRAIFATRGGYGAARLLRHVRSSAPPGPKSLVGYSDLTTLQMAASTLWPNVNSVYGPNIATPQLLDDSAAASENRAALHQALFDSTAQERQVHPLRSGVTSGHLIGGCLSCLVSLIGTPWEPNLRGSIVFLEDTGEAPYKIDRMLTQLRDCGLLSDVRGYVFGRMPGCTDPYNDLRLVILDVLGAADSAPVAFGVPTGHGPANLALRLGGEWTLDCDLGHLTELHPRIPAPPSPSV